MKIVIATTTGFHLRRLATFLAVCASAEVDLRYFSYMPRFRLRQEGIPDDVATSLFASLLPLSALALVRQFPHLRAWATEALFGATDTAIARRLQPCDVFIGLSSMAVRSAEEAKRRYGAKVIIERGSRHVLSQDELVRAGGGKGLSRSWIDRELAGYAAADYVTVLSSHAAASFVERGFPRERLFVNPLGVDLSQFRPTPRPSGPPKLIFVGAWSTRKGVDLLDTAMGRRPEWLLTHVGPLDDVPPSLQPNVSHVGTMRHPELARAFAEHHVLVLPSREDGFGMVLLEGLAAGLPVVATDMTGGPDIRERLENPSMVEICRAGDASSLLTALDAQITREANLAPDRQRLSATDCATFSWDAYGQRYLAFLSTLTSELEVSSETRA